MSAELERLKTWLAGQRMNNKAFSQSLGYVQSPVGRILTGEKPISRSFKWLFAREYGDELAATIFDEPVPASAKFGSDYHPERRQAEKAVSLKANKDAVPPAHHFLCYGCKKKQAEHNHHPDYGADHRLWVIPLCRSCHVKVHKGSLELQLPIAPELVRIPLIYKRQPTADEIAYGKQLEQEFQRAST